MAGEQLVTGCNGEIERGFAGTALSDTGTLTVDTYYRIDAVGAGSALDSDLVGFLYKADGTEALVSDDTVTPFTFVRIGFISSWDLNVNKDKYEVTQLGKCTRGYIAGLKEVTSSFEGTRDIQDAEQADIINNFMEVISDNVISAQQDDDLFLKLTVDNKETVSGKINEFYFGKFIADSFTTNQSSTAKSDFSFNGTVDGANNTFALYREEVA
jgi:hypothetical protein